MAFPKNDTGHRVASVIENLTAHCQHPAEALWLTMRMTSCAHCGASFSRKHYPQLEARAMIHDPKVHCRKWRLGDDRQKHHGFACTKAGKAIMDAMNGPISRHVN